MPDTSRYLSLITGGSFTHAALGAVSEGGIGNPESEVRHNIPSGSTTLIAVQRGGSSGGMTSSNFSSKIVIKSPLHGGGVGTRVPIILRPGSRFQEKSTHVRVGQLRGKEPIPPTAAMPATTKKSERRTFRNRGRVNAFSKFIIPELPFRRFTEDYLKLSTLSGRAPHRQARAAAKQPCDNRSPAPSCYGLKSGLP